MASVTIQDYSNTTLKVTVDGIEYVIKKAYVTTAVDGDYVNIKYHGYEISSPRYLIEVLYTDCTSPVSASAVLLNATVLTYLNNYGAGGTSSYVLVNVEVDLGSYPRSSGSFNITSAGLTSGKPVTIGQAIGAYTGKGTLTDEAEMDGLIVSGATTSTTNIVCYWNSPTLVKGNFKFNYIIST